MHYEAPNTNNTFQKKLKPASDSIVLVRSSIKATRNKYLFHYKKPIRKSEKILDTNLNPDNVKSKISDITHAETHVFSYPQILAFR